LGWFINLHVHGYKNCFFSFFGVCFFVHKPFTLIICLQGNVLTVARSCVTVNGSVGDMCGN